MKKIIYLQPNGVLAVVTPVINTHPVREGISEGEAIQRSIKRLPRGVSYQIVDESKIPVDRTFRDGWVVGKGCVEHDLAKCRELHRQKLREMRAPLLADLDVSYMRADESGDQLAKEEIKAKKQALRDVTADPRIDAAASIDDLKNAIPRVLLG
jgi:hypothetical protein